MIPHDKLIARRVSPTSGLKLSELHTKASSATSKSSAAAIKATSNASCSLNGTKTTLSNGSKEQQACGAVSMAVVEPGPRERESAEDSKKCVIHQSNR
eukprot:5983141-Pyramimonas_sp.AAC.1